MDGCESRRVHIDEPRAALRVAAAVRQLLESTDIRGGSDTAPQIPMVLCIGTDRSTGDSLGPLVGTLLNESMSFPWPVRGTLHQPVHAVNLPNVLSSERVDDRLVVAVDASLGAVENVGGISVGKGPIYPGAGVHKKLPPVGDFHITATVNTGGKMEYTVLQNTRLSFVMDLAETVAAGLWAAAYPRKTRQLRGGRLGASRSDAITRRLLAGNVSQGGMRSPRHIDRGAAAPTRTEA